VNYLGQAESQKTIAQALNQSLNEIEREANAAMTIANPAQRNLDSVLNPVERMRTQVSGYIGKKVLPVGIGERIRDQLNLIVSGAVGIVGRITQVRFRNFVQTIPTRVTTMRNLVSNIEIPSLVPLPPTFTEEERIAFDKAIAEYWTLMVDLRPLIDVAVRSGDSDKVKDVQTQVVSVAEIIRFIPADYPGVIPAMDENKLAGQQMAQFLFPDYGVWYGFKKEFTERLKNLGVAGLKLGLPLLAIGGGIAALVFALMRKSK